MERTRPYQATYRYDAHLADLLSAQDYYPFGMRMPGRAGSLYLDTTAQNVTFQLEAAACSTCVKMEMRYRYGFNGKEDDPEWQGKGNSYDYGFRIYNPRIGKFLSVDPLFKDYPYKSPYDFAENTPIIGIDLDGLELVFANSNDERWKKIEKIVVNDEKVKSMANPSLSLFNNINNILLERGQKVEIKLVETVDNAKISSSQRKLLKKFNSASSTMERWAIYNQFDSHIKGQTTFSSGLNAHEFKNGQFIGPPVSNMYQNSIKTGEPFFHIEMIKPDRAAIIKEMNNHPVGEFQDENGNFVQELFDKAVDERAKPTFKLKMIDPKNAVEFGYAHHTPQDIQISSAFNLFDANGALSGDFKMILSTIYHELGHLEYGLMEPDSDINWGQNEKLDEYHGPSHGTINGEPNPSGQRADYYENEATENY